MKIVKPKADLLPQNPRRLLHGRVKLVQYMILSPLYWQILHVGKPLDGKNSYFPSALWALGRHRHLLT